MSWLQGTRFMAVPHEHVHLRRGGRAVCRGREEVSQGFLQAAEPGEVGGMPPHGLVERGPWRGQEVLVDLRAGGAH